MEGTLIPLELVFDTALALALVGFAAVLLTTRDLFEAIVLFIVFGLLMAVTWSRLGAVDIALAEAAIGTGITGAMLLNARGDLEMSKASATTRPMSPIRRFAFGGLLLALTGMLVSSLASLPTHGPGLRETAFDRLPESGVVNPVTAVLLNYRAYDTFLELAVLLIAVLGVWSHRVPRVTPTPETAGLVLCGTVRLLVPLSVLIGGYLLWRGSHDPGGAFQAGAVLAGAGVLLALADHSAAGHWTRMPLRVGSTIGVLAFAAFGTVSLARGEEFLFYRNEEANTSILVLEVAATLSLALILVALFSGHAPEGEEPA